MYPQQIIDALEHVRYPGTGKNLIESGMLEDDIRISGMEVSFSIIFDKDNDPFRKSVVKAAETAIHTYVDEHAAVHVHMKFRKQNAPLKSDEMPSLQAKHAIAIHSGKGGVGKSTVAANLAITLAKKGYKVGLLDADIHGPSVPKMFHTEGCRPVSTPVNGRNLIEPIEQYGVKMLSIGYFVDPQQAVVWRGGMASNAIKQLILDANWGELDYFLIDLPPGTSDIHLSLVQHIRLTGAIVVTTPQAVALVDARKGVDMFQNEKINVPVLGLVENMAWFTPAELPENRYYIFGKDGGKELADELNIPLLGQLPLVQSIREGGDEGMPIALQDGHPAAAMFEAIVDKIENQ
jgi:ATP-binding protein involved in chromosome partitioning